MEYEQPSSDNDDRDNKADKTAMNNNNNIEAEEMGEVVTLSR